MRKSTFAFADAFPGGLPSIQKYLLAHLVLKAHRRVFSTDKFLQQSKRPRPHANAMG